MSSWRFLSPSPRACQRPTRPSRRRPSPSQRQCSRSTSAMTKPLPLDSKNRSTKVWSSECWRLARSGCTSSCQTVKTAGCHVMRCRLWALQSGPTDREAPLQPEDPFQQPKSPSTINRSSMLTTPSSFRSPSAFASRKISVRASATPLPSSIRKGVPLHLVHCPDRSVTKSPQSSKSAFTTMTGPSW